MKNKYFELKNFATGASKFVDSLNNDRQIDIDDDGDPIVIGYKTLSDKDIRVYIARNNKQVHFTMNPRGRVIKDSNFDVEDGFVRDDTISDKSLEQKNDDAERVYRAYDESEDMAAFIKDLMGRDK